MKSHFPFSLFLLLFLPFCMEAQDNLKVKDSNGNVLLEARQEGVLVRKLTTTERIAITGLGAADNGLIAYDTDTKSLWHWQDSAWIEIDGVDLVNDADADPANELQSWSTLPGIPSPFADGTDDVNDADSDPANELQSWSSLPGIPSPFADGTDDVNDADSDPTNELQSWSTLPGIPSPFADGTDNVNDADSDPTNELQSWSTLPGIPSPFADGIDDVNDADSDPTNELQTWSTLPGIPSGFADGTDNVNDDDSDPLNEKNMTVSRNGTHIEITDAGGTLSANIGWAVDADKVFNTTDNIGVGTNVTPARLTVQNGAALFHGSTGTTPLSGAGTRMMWIPAKASFRSGTVNGTQWDDANIGTRSFVLGGLDNTASGFNAGVAGGGMNSATANRAFVGGGFTNTASGFNTSVSGGESNTASGFNSSISGGASNMATNTAAFIGGGISNTASGGNSFVGAGLSNTASGYASFATGRESTASGNHAFAGGFGLLAESFGETVFGAYNSDYTPSSATGFVNTDRLFVIGKGTDNANRSNAMTILKNGKIGLGVDLPQTGLHVKYNAPAGEHVMTIENANHLGNGLRIKIDGSHPLFVTGEGGNPDFFITHPGAAIVDVFEPLANDIRTYLLSNSSFDISDIDFTQIASPGGLLDQLGLVDLMTGGICKGAETLVGIINSVAPDVISLPDLPLDAIPLNLPDIPVIPEIPGIPNFSVNPPPWEVCGIFGNCYEFDIPGFSVSSAFINTPIDAFNNGLGVVNTGFTNLNTTLENGYDNLRSGLAAIDNLDIPIPQFQAPTQIGPMTCPNPNPWDNFSFSFESLNPLDYNVVNSLTSENAFITFSDQYDNKLGAITAQGLGEFSQDYFTTEKVLEIGGHVTGMFSDDGNIVENLQKLGKEAIAYYKATDKIGVQYESGHGDYAEWLERENVSETIGYGDIIGIRGGRISLSIENAEQVMVVSKAPIVLGNAPQRGKEKNGNNIAFIGQVPVKVMGPVHTGDYIIANPQTPGYGLAVSADDITSEQLAIAVGRSWETNLAEGFKFVNTLVGMHNNGWSVPVSRLQQRLDEQSSIIESLAARLDHLESEKAVASAKRERR